MSILPPRDLVRYSPALEHPEPDEAESAESLVETMRGIIETTHRDTGHVLRSVHAKSHSLLRPLGSINRTRKAAYEMSASRRGAQAGLPKH